MLDPVLMANDFPLSCSNDFWHVYKLADAKEGGPIADSFCQQQTDPELADIYPYQCLVSMVQPPTTGIDCAFTDNVLSLSQPDGRLLNAKVSGSVNNYSAEAYEFAVSRADIVD